mmetsp:Transcript_14830/g.19412  ORF Transcript_14830/g.19412 Transcript_14830/m.19412 type:complete len:448 (+) Transcript_14830:114-1457(+)|eukprot:CAMPEP_0198147532 /NCGR_PEP_ID=MMETSP1443-20131203/36394_1 /TAXON_ID=186043 /ORGANISM="Entomoneis sp., Strain CCMP2396" /LENGTH=447 /DNA_ID=CAMNT_0043811911 /DNA_START=109 /DNA_END=1452 /DNA_ORIENTATION=+
MASLSLLNVNDGGGESVVSQKRQQQQQLQLQEHLLQSSTDTPAFVCPVCYEPFDDTNEEFKLRDTCGHSFCRSCLLHHCQHCISIKKVPIPCPKFGDLGRDSCVAVLSNESVHEILRGDSEVNDDDNKNNHNTVWNKYLRFVMLSKDPSLVACPQCDELLDPPPQNNNSNNNNKTNQMTCTACQLVFCQIHGNAHAPTTLACQAYMDSLQVQESERVLQKHTRPCPHCGCRIFKHAGCDHVVCPACHEDMCFKCGEYKHLTGKLVRTCQNCNQGYLDHRYDYQHRIRALLWFPFLLPFMVIYVVILTAICIGTGLFCCCCGCKMNVMDENNGDSGAMNNNNNNKDITNRQRTKAQDSSSLPNGVDGQSATTQSTTPDEAIKTGFCVILLPILFFLSDFGWHFDFVDQLMDGGNNLNAEKNGYTLKEIPTMNMEDEEESKWHATIEEV